MKFVVFTSLLVFVQLHSLIADNCNECNKKQMAIKPEFVGKNNPAQQDQIELEGDTK